MSLINYKTYTSVNQLPDSWNNLVTYDLMLQKPYIKALEEASPNNISLYYIGVFNNQELVGVAMIQRVELYLKDMFRNGHVSCFKQFVRNNISKVLKGNILVVGNLTHTGQHGLFYKKEAISQADFLQILFKAVNELKKFIRENKGKKIRLILFKDYFEDDSIHKQEEQFLKQNFYKMKVQPNMIMHTNTKWLSIEDYLAALSKKYKRRYKRARVKYNGIVCKELDFIEIESHSERLYELYKNVSDNAKFNTFVLPKEHFLSLKRQLKEEFRVYGYFLNDKLIGFYTLILNNSVLETYFLGYDKAHQYENQMYLNMLYDMIEFGINNKSKSIVYARTAMEIKSSVGAKPKTMFMYLKHTNRIANGILKRIFNLMNPSQNWEERHPFKP